MSEYTPVPMDESYKPVQDRLIENANELESKIAETLASYDATRDAVQTAQARFFEVRNHGDIGALEVQAQVLEDAMTACEEFSLPLLYAAERYNSIIHQLFELVGSGFSEQLLDAHHWKTLFESCEQSFVLIRKQTQEVLEQSRRIS